MQSIWCSFPSYLGENWGQLLHSVMYLWDSQVALPVKNPPASAGDVRDMGLVPGLGRSPGGGNGNPLQSSCLENPMDRGACRATAHGVAKRWTELKQLSMHTIYL